MPPTTTSSPTSVVDKRTSPPLRCSSAVTARTACSAARCAVSETAAAFAALGAPASKVEPRWDEFDPEDVLDHHGDSTVRLQSDASDETLTSRAFQAALDPALAEWVAHAERSPTGQTWPRFSGAGTAALSDLAGELTSGETAIVVTSAGAIAALVGNLLGAPEQIFPALNRVLVNAAVTKLAIGSTGINVISINDHSHLEEIDRALGTRRRASTERPDPRRASAGPAPRGGRPG